MLKKIALFLALVVLIIPVAACAAQPTQPVALKIGSMPRVFDLIAYVGQQDGIFQKNQATVEIVPFRSTVEMNTALLSGQLDGMIQDIFEAVNLNKGQKTSKVVGWSVMPQMFEVVASPQSGINSPADLKGKSVATATATIMDYGMDRLLAASGLQPGDIVKVNIPALPLRLEALNQGKVPVAILTPPLSSVAVAAGAKIIMDDRGQPFAGPGLIFSSTALQQKSDAIGRCVKAWQESVATINASPEKYRSLLYKVATIPESLNFSVPVFPQLRLPTQADIDPVVEWMKGQGIMKGQLNIQEIVEPKYLGK